VKNIRKGLGDDQGLYYQTHDGNYHSEEKAREMEITNSTRPTKNKQG
jgi:hypothetical protein